MLYSLTPSWVLPLPATRCSRLLLLCLGSELEFPGSFGWVLLLTDVCHGGELLLHPGAGSKYILIVINWNILYWGASTILGHILLIITGILLIVNTQLGNGIFCKNIYLNYSVHVYMMLFVCVGVSFRASLEVRQQFYEVCFLLPTYGGSRERIQGVRLAQQVFSPLSVSVTGNWTFKDNSYYKFNTLKYYILECVGTHKHTYMPVCVYSHMWGIRCLYVFVGIFLRNL